MRVSESIAAIEVGDYVLAWNETDGTLGYYAVTAVFSHADEILTELIINGKWIETTPEHPFYVEGIGWVDAEDLRTGNQVRQADGTTGTVWLKWTVYRIQAMYNLTVDTAHTFFVGEGQWLVHNAGCGIDLKDYAPSSNKSTAFSGVYDPDSKNILLKPSGETLLANGNVPDFRALRNAGHRQVADLLRKEYSVLANNPMGFTVFYTKPGAVAVEWISGLNRRFGDRMLPTRYRQPILNHLKRELGVLVE